MIRRMEEIVKSAYNGEVLEKEEKSELMIYLRHIPNCRKTEEEWKYIKNFV